MRNHCYAKFQVKTDKDKAHLLSNFAWKDAFAKLIFTVKPDDTAGNAINSLCKIKYDMFLRAEFVTKHHLIEFQMEDTGCSNRMEKSSIKSHVRQRDFHQNHTDDNVNPMFRHFFVEFAVTVPQIEIQWNVCWNLRPRLCTAHLTDVFGQLMWLLANINV